MNSLWSGLNDIEYIVAVPEVEHKSHTELKQHSSYLPIADDL